MAVNDMRIRSGQASASRQFRTQAAGTQILPGEPVKKAGNFVASLANGDCVVDGTGTNDIFVGVAASTSTETATDDGFVEVVPHNDSLEYEMAVTTPANMDTQAELDALLFNRVTVDLAGGIYTLDENDADDRLKIFEIVGGDITRGIAHFRVTSGFQNIDNVS